MERKIIMSTLRKILAPLAIIAVAILAPLSASAQFADQATYIATPGGTANAITLAVDNWNINRPGVVLRFLPASQNTASTTVVVNGVGGALAIKKQTGIGLTNLVGGELVPTQIAAILFDGTQWQLLTPPAPPPPPGGYLTACQVTSPSPVSGCTAGQIVPTGDVSSATTLYYEGMSTNLVPIFNGSTFVPRVVTEAQMTLILSATANLADHLYDVCVYDNAGTPAIGTMVGWSSFAAGSSARGTAAAIKLVNGLWVNSLAVDVTNNNITVNVPANKCTVVATILIDGVNGQVSFTRNFGSNRRWAAFNFYNRQNISIRTGLAAGASYTLAAGTNWQFSNGGSGSIGIRVPYGLQDENLDSSFNQTALLQTASSGIYPNIGICYNSGVSNIAGKIGVSNFNHSVGTIQLGADLHAEYSGVPGLGTNLFQACEKNTTSLGGLNATAAANMMPGEIYMILRVNFRG